MLARESESRLWTPPILVIALGICASNVAKDISMQLHWTMPCFIHVLRFLPFFCFQPPK